MISLRYLLCGLLVFFIAAVGSGGVQAREKHALIIANKDYIHGGALTNPIKDSRALAQTLRDAGFTVSVRKNLGLTQMRATISEFGLQHSMTDNVALVYYSGHGAEFNGKNYLIPVDAKLQDARKARHEALTLLDVQNFMYREISDKEREAGKNAKGLNIIILDACRNNPYPARSKATQRGLGKVAGASGTLIWYAAQPGARASDGADEALSPFAASFIEAVKNSRGEDIEATFKKVARLTLKATKGEQEPWISGNILGRFSFKPGPLRIGSLRYLKDFDPAQLDELKQSVIPRPKEWVSIRKTFGNWKFGSMGKYFGDTFVSFGGIWQETGSSKMPYVVLEPIRHKSYFLGGYSFYKFPASTKKPGKNIVAILWLVFSETIPKTKPKILVDKAHTAYTYYTYSIDGSSVCNNRKLFLGCQYPIFLAEEAVKAFKKYKRIYVNFRDKTPNEVQISLKDWAVVSDFNSSMNKLARISKKEAQAGTYQKNKNIRQCSLEYERLINADVDHDGTYIDRWAPGGLYVKSALKKIKKLYEAGDRECAFIYGHINLNYNRYGSRYNSDRRRGKIGDLSYREALKLVLEGVQHKPTRLRRYFTNAMSYWMLMRELSSAEIFDLAKFPLLLKYSLEAPKKMKGLAERVREKEVKDLSVKALEHCKKKEKASGQTSEKLACYQEFAELFPKMAEDAELAISQLKHRLSCGSAKKIWTFLKHSKNIESLNKFISEHPKCAEAQSARNLLKTLSNTNIEL